MGAILYKTYIVTKLYIKLHKMLFFVHIAVHIMCADEMKKCSAVTVTELFACPNGFLKAVLQFIAEYLLY